VDELHYALVRGEPQPDRPVLVRVHEPFVSLDLFDFDANRHAYSVQDALRIVAHHKEGRGRAAAPPRVALRIRRNPHAPGTRPARGARAQALGSRACTASARRSCATWCGPDARPRAPKRIPSMSGFGLEVVEYVSPDDPVVKVV
jgi:3,4-dihydroxy 2-butanone 4-phosphate synthase/GTP cyclohydrolase II